MSGVKSKDFKQMITKFVQMNIGMLMLVLTYVDIEIQKLDEWKTMLSKLTDE